MEKTPWLLVIVPRPVPFTKILAAGSARRLSEVITTPYSWTTESLKLSNCALAATGNRGKANIKKYRKNFFMKRWGNLHPSFPINKVRA
jgi:hypothetical protein